MDQPPDTKPRPREGGGLSIVTEPQRNPPEIPACAGTQQGSGNA
jgi:hypothetical protein